MLLSLIISGAVLAQAHQEQDSGPSREQVQQWVRGLDADRPAERERCETLMIAHGCEAEAAEASKSGTGETRERADRVVRTIGFIRSYGLDSLWRQRPALVRELLQTGERQAWVAHIGRAVLEKTPPVTSDEAKRLSVSLLQDKDVRNWIQTIALGPDVVHPEEEWLVRAALEGTDLKLQSFACLIYERKTEFLRPEDAPVVVDRLFPLYGHGDDERAELSTRALTQVVVRFLDGKGSEKIVDAARAKLDAADPESRRRGANLIGGIAKKLDPETCDLAAVDLQRLAALEVQSEREGVAHQMSIRALAALAPRLSAEAAAPACEALLAQLECAVCKTDQAYFGRPHVYFGIAGAATRLPDGELRRKALTRLVDAVGDSTLFYMLTSGVQDRPRHAGAEAVQRAAGVLDGTLLIRAVSEVEQMSARTPNQQLPFDEALRVLRERQAALKQ